MEFFINALPGVLPLIAALIVCVISFIRNFSTNKFVIVFSVAVIIFYCIGLIVKRILRKQYDEAMEAFNAEAEAAAAEKAMEEEAVKVQQQQ